MKIRLASDIQTWFDEMSLGSYEIIQLPHHGKLDDAKRIFEESSSYRFW